MPKRKKKKVKRKTKYYHSKRQKRSAGLRNVSTANGSASSFQAEAGSGYHIVGPGQAMMEYGQALIDIRGGAANKKEMNEILQVTGLLWNLALTDDPPTVNKTRKKLKSMHPDWIDDKLIDMMLDRHRRMFPTLMTDPPMAIKVHVIDPPEKIELFDESNAVLKTEILPPDPKEKKVIKSFHQVEERLGREDNRNTLEKELTKSEDALLNIFKKWCGQKGVASDATGDFVFAAGRLLDYFHGYERVTLADAGQVAIEHFMNDFWLRKATAKPIVMSAMPRALECFYMFLVEKEYMMQAERQLMAIKENRAEFLIILHSYFKPESIGKEGK